MTMHSCEGGLVRDKKEGCPSGQPFACVIRGFTFNGRQILLYRVLSLYSLQLKWPLHKSDSNSVSLGAQSIQNEPPLTFISWEAAVVNESILRVDNFNFFISLSGLLLVQVWLQAFYNYVHVLLETYNSSFTCLCDEHLQCLVFVIFTVMSPTSGLTIAKRHACNLNSTVIVGPSLDFTCLRRRIGLKGAHFELSQF